MAFWTAIVLTCPDQNSSIVYQKGNQQNTSQNSQKASSQKEKNEEGEYVDFEEIK